MSAKHRSLSRSDAQLKEFIDRKFCPAYSLRALVFDFVIVTPSLAETSAPLSDPALRERADHRRKFAPDSCLHRAIHRETTFRMRQSDRSTRALYISDVPSVKNGDSDAEVWPARFRNDGRHLQPGAPAPPAITPSAIPLRLPRAARSNCGAALHRRKKYYQVSSFHCAHRNKISGEALDHSVVESKAPQRLAASPIPA